MPVNPPSPALDLSAVAPPMFLELPGLGRRQPLPRAVRRHGGRLPGLHVRGRADVPAAQDPAAHPATGAAGLLEGESADEQLRCIGVSREPSTRWILSCCKSRTVERLGCSSF